MKRICVLALVFVMLVFASGSCFAALDPAVLSLLASSLELNSNDDMVILANYSEEYDIFAVTAQIPYCETDSWEATEDYLKPIIYSAFIEMSESVNNTLDENGNYSTNVYTFLELSDGRILSFTQNGEHFQFVD